MNTYESVAREALALLFSQDLVNRPILEGLAYALSWKGLTRANVMDFFWEFYQAHQHEFTEAQLDLEGDFRSDLAGLLVPEHSVRLHGEPDGFPEFYRFVRAEADKWQPK